MHTIHLDPELAATIEALQADSTENVEEAVRVAANEAVRTALYQLIERMLEAEQTSFAARHAELVAKYLGKYVAIYHGDVIESDTDERALYTRVFRLFRFAS
jgi:hypothetical protein